jgi:hypothetical protein
VGARVQGQVRALAPSSGRSLLPDKVFQLTIVQIDMTASGNFRPALLGGTL